MPTIIYFSAPGSASANASATSAHASVISSASVTALLFFFCIFHLISSTMMVYGGRQGGGGHSYTTWFYAVKPRHFCQGFYTVRGWEVNGLVFSVEHICVLNKIFNFQFNINFLALDKKIQTFLKGSKFS